MVFFLAMGRIEGRNSRQNLKIIDLNRFLSMRKIIDFCPRVRQVSTDHYADLSYFSLGERTQSSPYVYPYTIKPYGVFNKCTGFSNVSRTHIHQNLKFYFFVVASYFSLYSEITFSNIHSASHKF